MPSSQGRDGRRVASHDGTRRTTTTPVRRPRRRLPQPRRRLEATLIIILMVLSVIGGRLVQLQGLDSSTYATLALDQSLRHDTLTAQRGSITDRDGQPIAESVAADDIVADPTLVAHRDATATTLSRLLRTPRSTLLTQLSGTSHYALLATAVTPTLAQRVMKLDLAGLYTTPTSRRLYPNGGLASNVVGFVNAAGVGAGGIELAYQKLLAGRNGRQVYQAAPNGDPIPDGEDVVDKPVPGGNVRLTLQRDIQYYAQQQIAEQVRKTKALSGTVIVMDPANGQVLAMAVAPGFNPNRLAAATPADLGNPAIADPYEPGSVNKIITMSAALEDHVATPTSPYVIPPELTVAGTPFHDAETHGTEDLTLSGILAESSNIGAIEVAKQLGGKRLETYLKAYGFGSPTGLGLPGESAGFLLPMSQWSGTTLPTLAFGQGGIEVTAMQVASVYATIANDGVRVAPSIVEGTTTDGTFHPAAAPARRRVISVRTASELRRMLEGVVTEQGTAPEAEIPGYAVAGKTGTANRIGPTGTYAGGGYTASFVGMVPASHPKLVCEVVLQRPRTTYFGGAAAGPVFHNVMSFALQTLGIAPSKDHVRKYPITW